MPRIVETTVYQFDELTDKAKEAARNWWRDAGVGDNSFAESVIQDAVEIAALFGLTIGERTERWVNTSTHKSGTTTSPTIFWSGFFCQGDGACFEGRYEYKADASTAVKSEAPTDLKLHGIVARIQEAQEGVGGKVALDIKHSDSHYYHARTMRFESLADEDQQGPETEALAGAEKAVEDALIDFANWIYKQLEEAYEWEMSDEHVDESIRINEYEFTADGKPA